MKRSCTASPSILSSTASQPPTLFAVQSANRKTVKLNRISPRRGGGLMHVHFVVKDCFLSVSNYRSRCSSAPVSPLLSSVFDLGKNTGKKVQHPFAQFVFFIIELIYQTPHISPPSPGSLTSGQPFVFKVYTRVEVRLLKSAVFNYLFLFMEQWMCSVLLSIRQRLNVIDCFNVRALNIKVRMHSGVGMTRYHAQPLENEVKLRYHSLHIGVKLL